MVNKLKSVLLTQYCSSDKIEKNEMDGAFSAYGQAEAAMCASYDAHIANYTLYNRFLHNMICCHNTLFTRTN